MLALEGRIENFTLGKEVSLTQVEQTQQMARKHGFRLAGFRSFERAITEEEIEQICQRAESCAEEPPRPPCRHKKL